MSLQYCIQGVFFLNLNSVLNLALDTQNSSLMESLPSGFAKIIKFITTFVLGGTFLLL